MQGFLASLLNRLLLLSAGGSVGGIISFLYGGDAGLTVGYQTPNGVDLGRQFMGGSTGVVTGYKDYSGIDLGSRFGNDPWVAQGYTPCTMLVGSYIYLEDGGDESSEAREVFQFGFFYNNEWHGAMSDNSLIGTNKYKSCVEAERYGLGGKNFRVDARSKGSKQTSVVINGVAYPINRGVVYSNAKAAYDYLKAHDGQNITIYLK